MSARARRTLLLGMVAVITAACQEGAPTGASGGARLELASADSTRAEVGGLVQPVVRLTYGGLALKNVNVSWSADGDAEVDEVTQTDAQGLATAHWYLGSRPGPYHLLVTGAGRQTLRVTATAQAGALRSLHLVPDSAVLASVRDSVQLSVTARDRFGNALPAPPVEWSSLDPLVAVVGTGGMVRGRSGGTARVVVQFGVPADTAFVRVVQLPWQLALTPRLDTLRWLAGTLALQARVSDVYGNEMPNAPITWSSATPGVVTVSTSGLVTAVSNGAGRVVARSGTAADTATVMVAQVVEGIRLSPIAATVVVGDSVKLTATTHDRTNHPVATFPAEWSSANESVATVTAGTGVGIGWVTGVSAGTATIRVFSTGGVFATATITVVEPTTP